MWVIPREGVERAIDDLVSVNHSDLLVIPREGVERENENRFRFRIQLYVIPREGVESETIHDNDDTERGVIPREGVESISASTRSSGPMRQSGDPERGS